jgi:hypothetical protein
MAKWRIKNEVFDFPIEKKLKEWLKPTPQMS